MKKIMLILMLILLPASSFSQEIGNYLIMSNIGDYVFRPKRVITIKNAGALIPAGHFPGHGDMTYEGIYIHPQTYLGITVQVTKHAGSDSDKWLLHEVETKYRSTSKMGTLISGAEIRDFNGNKVFNWISYSWISNNVVVYINWTPKPDVNNSEPLEVIQAYLQKFPSTVPTSLALDKAHDATWIKDEMDRRLWLCDKWFLQITLKKADEKKVYQECVKSMNVFLDYREKYYSIKAADEKNLLASYLNTNNGTGIKAKLTEYKNWWMVHKSDAISL